MIKKPLDQVIGYVMEAVDNWKVKNTPEVLHAKVTRLLDKNAEEITLKLLGFNTNWKEWNLDHCNGRSGNSAIGDYLRNAKAIAIKDFFDSMDINSIVTPAMKARLTKVVQKEFEHQLGNAVANTVAQHTATYVNKVVSDITASDDIESVIKTIKLIGTTP